MIDWASVKRIACDQPGQGTQAMQDMHLKDSKGVALDVVPAQVAAAIASAALAAYPYFKIQNTISVPVLETTA